MEQKQNGQAFALHEIKVCFLYHREVCSPPVQRKQPKVTGNWAIPMALPLLILVNTRSKTMTWQSGVVAAHACNSNIPVPEALGSLGVCGLQALFQKRG